jgi:16S rRNA (uracil1498-N3)-methyltransferase
MRYFYWDGFDQSNPWVVIEGPDARHIKNVLRLKPGEEIGLFDGRGMEYIARIESFHARGIQVRVLVRRPSQTESTVDITIAQALLKERKMDGLVRQLTELGARRWIPFYAQRSIPKPDRRRAAARVQRWEKISREALKQCRRGRVMEIQSPISLNEVFIAARASDLKIVFWENEACALDAAHLPSRGKAIQRIFAVLGPEGGFSEQEIEAARADGFITAGLGPRILRAETAAVAAATLLQFLYGDLGKKT